MKNKGFTLAEVLGVVVIIGLLLLIASPKITNKLKNNEEKVDDINSKIIFEATKQYLEKDNKYISEDNYCIPISELVAEGLLTRPVINIKTKESIEEKYAVKITKTKYEIVKKADCK